MMTLTYDDLDNYTVVEDNGTYLVVWGPMSDDIDDEDIEDSFEDMDEAIQDAKERQAEYDEECRQERLEWLQEQVQSRLVDCDDADKLEQILKILKK